MLDFNKIQCEFLDSDVAVCLIFFRILTVISGTFPIKGKKKVSASWCETKWLDKMKAFLEGFFVCVIELPKIIFIIFFITFSPCVFWSQHASPLLLSPFNRWLKHTEGKAALASSRSNITMRKLNLCNEVFHITIFRRPRAGLFFCASFYPSLIQ